MHARFKDAEHRHWDLRLTVGLIERIKERTGVDFGQAFTDGKAFAALLFEEPRTIAAVLWLLVERQAKEGDRSVTPEEFAEGLDGETIQAASAAIQEALVLFRHPPEIARAMLAKLPAAMRTIESKAAAVMAAKMDQAVESISNPTSTTPPSLTSSASAGASPDYAE